MTELEIVELVAGLLVVLRYAAKWTETPKDDAFVKRATAAAKRVVG